MVQTAMFLLPDTDMKTLRRLSSALARARVSQCDHALMKIHLLANVQSG